MRRALRLLSLCVWCVNIWLFSVVRADHLAVQAVRARIARPQPLPTITFAVDAWAGDGVRVWPSRERSPDPALFIRLHSTELLEQLTQWNAIRERLARDRITVVGVCDDAASALVASRIATFDVAAFAATDLLRVLSAYDREGQAVIVDQYRQIVAGVSPGDPDRVAVAVRSAVAGAEARKSIERMVAARKAKQR
jgi:hypothetical protein